MAKLTDARVATLQGFFDSGDQPTEAQFDQLILWIQEGIEEHQHDSTGDGDGTGILNGPITVAEDAWIGIGAALERLVFDGSGGWINVLGTRFNVGTAGHEDVLVHFASDDLGALTMPAGNILLLEQDNNCFMNLVSGGTDHVGIRLGDPADTDSGYLVYENDNDAMVFGTFGSEAMRISIAGAFQWPNYGVGALTSDAAGNITAVSDARLKEQVRNTEIGLAEVLQMQGKAWHYTKESGLDTEHEYLGFIADDIEKIVPQAVGRMADGMRTLDPNALLPAVVKAIQELDTRLTNGGL